MIYRIYHKDGRPVGSMYIGGYSNPHIDFDTKDEAIKCLRTWKSKHDSYSEEFKKEHWIPRKAEEYDIKELPESERFVPMRSRRWND